MDFGQFFTVPMALLAIVVWVLVLAQRKVLELKWPNFKENRWWRELFLPLGPAGTGGILAVAIAKYPFPDVLAGSWEGRLFCGIVAGLGSGTVYRILKQFLALKSGQTDTSAVDNSLPTE